MFEIIKRLIGFIINSNLVFHLVVLSLMLTAAICLLDYLRRPWIIHWRVYRTLRRHKIRNKLKEYPTLKRVRKSPYNKHELLLELDSKGMDLLDMDKHLGHWRAGLNGKIRIDTKDDNGQFECKYSESYEPLKLTVPGSGVAKREPSPGTLNLLLKYIGPSGQRKGMKIERIEDIRPEAKDIVTLKKAGPVKEIRYMRSQAGTPIQKIDADHGVDLRTGEIIEYRHKISRIEDKASVRQSLKRLRDIINANLENPENALWVTLTYRENMTDSQQLYKNFHAFRKRFSRYLEKHSYPKTEYIAAAEPQGRGAWHLHCLFLFAQKAPYIPNTEIARLWGHGFTKTKSLKGITNPGLYLTAYLGDMEVTEAIQAGTLQAGKLAETSDKSKAVIKGARLKLYPKGFNLYRCSRGVKRPEVWQTTEEKAQAEISGMELIYEKTVSLTDVSGTLRNIINYRTYSNHSAKKGQ